MTIDIFCDVIDNFGDAGVCWRLASIFSCEHGFPVKLYINDAETLSKITAGLDPKKLPCLVQGVEIHDWKDAETSEPSQVVIETFGCRLPHSSIKLQPRVRSRFGSTLNTYQPKTGWKAAIVCPLHIRP